MSAPEIEHVGALTPVQQGMLYHLLREDDPQMYLEQGVGVLEGELDASALAEAWQTVVDRHAALRSAIVHRSLSRPAQVYYKRLEAPVSVVDGSRAAAGGEAVIEQERARHADRLRRIDSAPLVALSLLPETKTRTTFVLSAHHLVHDAWTLELMLRELFASYSAIGRRERPKRTPAPPFYRFASAFSQAPSDQAVAFFRDAVRNAPQRGLPGEDGPHEPDLRAGWVEASVGRARTAALETALRGRGLTLAAGLAAAWGLVSARAARRDDALFGVTLLGRPEELPNVQEAAGVFINTLPMRTRLQPATPVVEWLRERQETLRTLGRLELTSFPEVRARLGASSDRPLFENILVLQAAFDPSRWTTEAGLVLSGLKIHGRPHYPLMLRATPGPKLWLEALYQRNRISDDSARKLLQALTAALDALPTALDGALAGWISRVDEVLAPSAPGRRSTLRPNWSDVRPRLVTAE